MIVAAIGFVLLVLGLLGLLDFIALADNVSWLFIILGALALFFSAPGVSGRFRR